MQYLKYPTKVMNITQNYSNSFSHKPYSTGKPASYPIDEACEDSGRSYFYAPCDLIVKRIYGVGNSGANTIWLQSTDKVKLSNGKNSFVTILVQHPNDDTLSKLKVGQTIKQGDEVCLEGTNGNVTGNHFHIEVAGCPFSELKNNGWVKNSKGMWVISNNAIKPEEAFFVDETFTTIRNSQGLNFKEMPKENFTTGTYQTLGAINVRSGAGTNFDIKKIKDISTDGQKHTTSTNQNDYATYKNGTIFDVLEIITNNDGSIWGKGYSGYICLKDSHDQILCKKI